MFNTNLINQYIYFTTPAQAPFRVNFIYLNRFSSICHLFLNFVSFFESLKHICFSILQISIIFFFNPSRLLSCILGFKQIIFKYKMQIVDNFKIFFIIWKTKESTLWRILWKKYF